jgi:hypothetical protein
MLQYNIIQYSTNYICLKQSKSEQKKLSFQNGLREGRAKFRDAIGREVDSVTREQFLTEGHAFGPIIVVETAVLHKFDVCKRSSSDLSNFK